MEKANSSSVNLVNCLTSILKSIFKLENESTNDFGSTEELEYCFKVLILDNKVFNILSPMLKMYILREHNICFNMNMKDQRDKMPDVMAIYLITPTKENFNIILNDLNNNIFDNYSINIISYDASQDNDKKLIDQFYSDISNIKQIDNKIHNISIYPISISIYHPCIFSLDIKRPYLLLNCPNISEDKYKDYLTEISNGLFSSLFLTKTLPIIKYRSGYFAEDIIQKLQMNFNNFFEKFPEKKDEFIIRKNSGHTLLLLIDRDTDLPIMLHHASSMGSMLIDNFGLSRISSNKDSLIEEKEKKFEIDPINDFIWNNNLAEPFYKVGELIYKEYKQFYNDMNYLDKVSKPKDMEQLKQESEKLAQSIENLRDKKIIGNILTQNSNFYTKLNEYTTNRNLGELYENEDMLLRKRNFVTNDIKKKFNDILKKYTAKESDANSMGYDLYRLSLIYYLCSKPGSVNENELNSIMKMINKGIDMERIKSSFNYIKFKQEQTKSQSENNNTKTNYLHSGLKFFMNSINSLMTVEQPSLATDLINNLLTNKKVNDFVTYNLFKKSIEKESANLNYNYSDIIVFCIGGGSLGEYEYIDEFLKKSGKNVIYGCDCLYRPIEFLEDLEQLGMINIK